MVLPKQNNDKLVQVLLEIMMKRPAKDSKMSHRIIWLLAKPDDPSSLRGLHMLEGEKRLTQIV